MSGLGQKPIHFYAIWNLYRQEETEKQAGEEGEREGAGEDQCHQIA